jgi:hypothetical protein
MHEKLHGQLPKNANWNDPIKRIGPPEEAAFIVKAFKPVASLLVPA